jgi:scyllo-inositol 2-dehydrogenase (NADP+)
MLKMAIIGLGKMATAHADWINTNEELQLIAVCDLNRERVRHAAEQYHVEGFTDVEAMLGRMDLDYVVIVTTNTVHEELAVKALKEGINVIVEKPMAMNFESAQRMVQAAESCKRELFVHQSSRWDRDFLLVKETIESGRIGNLLQIQSRVYLCDEGWPSWGIDGMDNPWRIKAESGGGMLLDWGPHLVDQMLVLMKQHPVALHGMLQSGVWSKEVDDSFAATLHFENGIICQIEASNNGRIPAPRWYLIGTKGTLVVAGRHEPMWDEAEVVFDRPDGKTERHTIHLENVCESGLEGGFYRDLVPFIKGEIETFVRKEEAAKVIRVLDMIRCSSEEKRIITYEEK